MWAVFETDTVLFMLDIVGFFTQKAWPCFMSPLWKTGDGLLQTSENQCQSSNGTYSRWFSGPGLFNLLIEIFGGYWCRMSRHHLLSCFQTSTPPNHPPNQQIITKQCSKPSVVPFNPGLKNGIPMILIMDSIIRNVLNSKIPCDYQAA